MPLASGTRLGPYEILGALGAGGMGEVYRARDSRLGRVVAVKVLPAEFGQDPSRLQRFEDEARATAALNHPNILAIHDVGTAADVSYFVTELLEGRTLREVLSAERLSVARATEWATQIAAGLAAAHSRSIIHRDLKPENLFVTTDGRVKILDFGLAKSVQTDHDAPTRAVTASHAVLGTPAFMAPEQVRGEQVDHRTDVFALGAVLYEMLAGRRAFSGQTAQDVMSGILRDAPAPLPSTPDRPVSPALARIVERCLEKSPAARFQSTTDLAFALKSLSASDDSGLVTPARVGPVGEPYRRRRVPWTWVIGGAAVGTILAAAAIEMMRPAPNERADTYLSLLLPEGTDFTGSGLFADVAVAPDGRRVAFSAGNGSASRVFMRDLSSPTSTTVGPGERPFFSPDGRTIGFYSNGRLMKMATGAEAPQEICRAAPGGHVDWTPSGAIYFGEYNDSPTHGIRKCPAAGGETSDVSVLDRASGETHHGSPQLLPDGQTLLFTVTSRTSSGPTQRLAVQSIAGGPHRAILEDAAWGRYLGDGLLVYQRGESLFATRLNPRSLTVDGVGALVLDHVDRNLVPLPSWDYAAGLLSYRPADAKDLRIPVWVSPDGTESPLAGVRPDSYRSPRVAPDGRWISFWVIDGLKNDVVVYDVNREQVDRLTRDGLSRNGAWLPDSLSLIVQRQEQADVSRLVTVDADSGSEGAVLRRDKGRLAGYGVTRDRKTVLYGRIREQTGYDILISAAELQAPELPFVVTKDGEFGGRLAPNERWALFATTGEDKRNSVRAAPFPAGGVGRLIATDAREGLWSSSGREIYFRRGDQVWSAPVVNPDTLEVGKPRALFEHGYYQEGGPGNIQYDIAPNGHLVMLKDLPRAAAHFDLVQHWDAQVRRILERH